MSILIKNVELKGKSVDILTDGERITEIAPDLKVEAEHVIDKRHLAVIPSFYNTHTHAAMSLLRGVADDLHLMEWLEKHIWPLEAKMTDKDIYAGSKLSILEMIKSGTTFFNDMYWHPEVTIKAAKEMGVRASIGLTLLDGAGENGSKETVDRNFHILKEECNSTISLTIAPHAIYTVSEENLIWAKEFADKNDLMLHIHLAETETEVEGCIEKTGHRPVHYLEKIGFLGKNVIAAHNVWLEADEKDILNKREVKINHNPVSNMKLGVGNTFDYSAFKGVTLGTDGASSNNNLDMSEEMKIAALLQKHVSADPTRLPAREAFDMASMNGAHAFGYDAGRIKEGMLADMLLIDLRNPCMVPGLNVISDLVYAANGNSVDTTICNGKVLMEGRVVENEEKIREAAIAAARELIN